MTPHPRDTFDWFGPTPQEQAFLQALERGRLHHAWLVLGPEGVGKATFAYRAARRLLGARPRLDQGPLGASPDDHVCRLISQRAHPDLLVLQRDPEDGKTRRNIPVEEARELSPFFAKTPALSPYRVSIVDTADDLGAASANALLKTLEEPPERGVIFLLAKSTAGLLPTIVSRCRRVVIPTAENAEARAWVSERSGLGGEEAEHLLKLTRGSAGAAWRLADQGALDAVRTAARILDEAKRPAGLDLPALAESVRFGSGAERFKILFEALLEGVAQTALDLAPSDLRAAEAWSRAWTDMRQLQERLEAINLDRGEALLTSVDRLRALVASAH